MKTLFFSLCVLLCTNMPVNADPLTSGNTSVRSILVLPPLNKSSEPLASYSYLATVTAPLSQRGYYVFPVAVVDAFLKENGLPTPFEMHNVDPRKFAEIFGADAVLYVSIEKYGQDYYVLASATQVKITGKLVRISDEKVLWSGQASESQSSLDRNQSNFGDLLFNALADQVVHSNNKRAHDLTRIANTRMLWKLPFGPIDPNKSIDIREELQALQQNAE